jgi:RNA polymerase sigma-70 factor, ECF subfamily
LKVKQNESLVARASAGDDAAAAELIREIWPDAYRVAWSVLEDRSLAQDAAQEACARAWLGLRGLRRPERFAVWFYRIVVNESRRIQHASRRETTAPSEVPSQRGIALEDRVAVRAAIGKLEDHLRLPIVLRYYYSLRSAEIAQVLGISAVTVRWRIMLAHRRLATTLDDRASRPQSTTHSDGRYADESIAAS